MNSAQPIGVHAYLFGAPRSREDWRHVALGARAAGFDLVEVPLLEAADVDTEMISRALGEYQLAISCSAGLTAATDVSSEDPETVRLGEQALTRAVRAAAQIGSRTLSGVLYSSLAAYDHPVARRGKANCVEVLGRVAGVAELEGVTLGLEPVNRYETNLVNTAAQGLELIDAIGSQNVFLQLDTFHMNIEESDLGTPVQEAGSRLGYVHVGESHRGALGAGTVDFETFFGALQSTCYRGPIVFESFTAGVPLGGLQGALHVWRDLWDDAMAVGRQAREFLDAHISVARS